MRNVLFFLFMLGISSGIWAADMLSPNAKIKVVQEGNGCRVLYQDRPVLLVDNLTIPQSEIGQCKVGKARQIRDDYQMLTGKRLHCTNEANEYRWSMASGKWSMVMRVYNDGIAFRYESLPGKEQTAYKIPQGTKRWLQKWSDGYEGFYPLTTEASDGRWGYPALLEPQDGVFVLLSEANICKGQGASSLHSKGDIYQVVPEESASPLPSPWRVAIIGTLADVVESTLITDVAEPNKIEDTSWIQPGTVSWVYWAYNHGSNDYNIIKKYVDMAATLHMPYVLIDAEWDEMKDGKNIEDAVAYAKSCGVKPLIWYNSSVGWINGAPGPKFRLNKPEDREREFAWCERIGVAGVKIDFFSGDTQLNMDYCIELLESAAKHHQLVNFHGATIPRGWQRTYPNLMSTEGVYGAEWYNNVATFTDKAAAHNATLPFTRNVIGPMDYTPCAFSDSQHPHITSHAHELALTVLFESGLQHLADRPESFLAQPHDVQQFLSSLPTVWDETHLLSGYPGETVVMARRSGKTWYVAGVNGTNEEKKLSLEVKGNHTADESNSDSSLLSFQSSIKNHGDMVLFGDRGERAFNVSLIENYPTEITCQPRGGFVLVIHPAKTL